MMVSAYTPLVGQSPCANANFSLRVGDIETVGCFTVKVPVRLLSSLNPVTACDFRLSGTVSGGNARIEAIDLGSGFDASNIINGQTGFEIFGSDISTTCYDNPFARAPVEGVDICILPAGATSCSCDALPPCEFTYTSSKEGYFQTPDCAQGESYVLAACKTNTEDLSCGISTFDLMLISEHILGVEQFEDPRDLIDAEFPAAIPFLHQAH